MRGEWIIVIIVVIALVLIALIGCDEGNGECDHDTTPCQSITLPIKIIDDLSLFTQEERETVIRDGEISMRLLYRPSGGLSQVYSYTSSYYQNSICRGGDDKWVSVGQHYSKYYSSDCETWTSTGYSLYNEHAQGVAYGNSKYVMVGSSGIYYFTNAADTPTAATGDPSSVYLTDVCYGDKFVTCGQKTTGGYGIGIYYSTDGNAWTAASSIPSHGSSCYPKYVTYTGTYYVMALWSAADDPKIIYSSDGSTWSECSDPPDGYTNGAGLAYGNGVVVVRYYDDTTTYYEAYATNADIDTWTVLDDDCTVNAGLCFGRRFLSGSSQGLWYGIGTEEFAKHSSTSCYMRKGAGGLTSSGRYVTAWVGANYPILRVYDD